MRIGFIAHKITHFSRVFLYEKAFFCAITLYRAAVRPPFCANKTFPTLFGILQVGRKGLSLLCKQGRTARTALPSFYALKLSRSKEKFSP
ncbi:MAG: hypothetical protein PUF44_02055 [Bacteroidales bacterium]|nr:hypothetical protein [Bacteroidales bacterium]